MPAENILILKCQRETCGLRYPVVDGQARSDRCPRCRGRVELVLERTLEEEPWRVGAANNHPSSHTPFPLSATTPNPSTPYPSPLVIHALLDNIRSAWNVGSMFRSADGAGIARLHLCGISPTPENASVLKTALGAECSVAWDYAPDGVARAEELRATGYKLWAVEQHPRAQLINEALLPESGHPLVLVVGNEISGVDPGILEHCEQIVYIPMAGAKRSLNVAVAFGIAAFVLRRTL